MHETQRRAMLRALFFFACVCPTVAVGLWAYGLRTDAYRESWERELSEALGMRTACEAVALPQPGLVSFNRLRCYDPETDALVLECGRLEGEAVADGLLLAAVDCEIHAAHGAKLFTAVERRLKRELPGIGPRISFKAARLAWHAGGPPQTLDDFEALLEPTDSAQQLLVNFRAVGAASDEPASMRIARSTASAAPETIVELDSGAGPLPCSIFAPLVPFAADFGDAAQWSGRIKLKHAAAGWEGMLSGTIDDVDLQRFLAAHGSPPLWGAADLSVHWAEFAAGRVVRMRGSVEAGPGQIGRELAAAGVVQLGLGDPQAGLADEPALRFDRLEFDFSIDAGGLALRPRNATRHDALLWHGDQVYWHAPRVTAQPLANLLRTLSPNRELLVPLGPSVAGLIDVLPLPAASPAKPVLEANQNALPQPRLRLRGAAPDESQIR
ncbi:MAG: hypothetical protein JNL96_20315 [Planctomycetaceae bacterium]|nr:hypothetical protein [Planctomycetaceae bacterium]